MNYSEIAHMNLRDLDKNNRDQIVALHETGHFIAMLALGMFDKFEYITIEQGVDDFGHLTDGLTEMTPEAKEEVLNCVNNVRTKAENSGNSFDDYYSYCKANFIEGPKCYFPHIIRLFAGGSICRYYNNPFEERCEFDYDEIRETLSSYFMTDKFSEMKVIADAFLKNVFKCYDKVSKLICYNLIERRTLNKADIEALLKENKEAIFMW